MSPQVSASQSPAAALRPRRRASARRLLVVGQRVRVDGDDAVRARAGSTACRRSAAGGCARASRRRHPEAGRRPAPGTARAGRPEMIATSTRSASAISSAPMRGIDRGSWTARACRRGRTRQGGEGLSAAFGHGAPVSGEYAKGSAVVGGASLLVGVTGFEPAASSSRTTRATKLRHTPWQPSESTRCAELRSPNPASPREQGDQRCLRAAGEAHRGVDRVPEPCADVQRHRRARVRPVAEAARLRRAGCRSWRRARR